ncbi:uncharacterized protein LOC121974284 [Zingiber officinale]|uniref:Uncharacterized protein n=1 Tax=Zingiber officinale TaxID=94328 RepID=A0A8J5L951_ZINOF|nr:uncharacterized protein LOC121974284 [Zingiber officinale]XP_042381206.1 uncharacterized protein LOC121974284 [Zingiber officinale]XP_042381207.1 uncharacterized protein LOC121974284 [Zingiber officinale]KAG6509336.1 hypothetical protein ZIOFF_027321 [Zingiber officinale]
MTADAIEFSVGSRVEIEGSVGLGLGKDGDRKVSGDANGIACLVGEEKVSGRTGRLIAMGNGNLDESWQQDLDVDVKLDPVAVGDLEPIKVKGENGELTPEKVGDLDGNTDSTTDVSVTVDDDCKHVTTRCVVEEEGVESDSGSVAKEGIGEALEGSLGNEVRDEKVRDIASGICGVNEKACSEEGIMELSLENGQDHVEDGSSREAAKPDLHVEVEKQESKILVKDADFEKEESTAEVGKESNALVTAIDKHSNLELSVYDENQQCESLGIETQLEEESKIFSVEDDKQESKNELKLNNIHYEKEEVTVVIADEKQEIFTLNTDDNSQAYREMNVLLLETEGSESVFKATKKHDQEKLVIPETHVSDNKEQEALELATKVELIEEPQDQRMCICNQGELISAVEVQQEQNFEGLVTENQPYEYSADHEHIGRPTSEECLEENRTHIVVNSIANLETVDSSGCSKVHNDLPAPEISAMIDEAVASDETIGGILIVEQSNDLHPKEDCCSSDVSCVAESKSLDSSICPQTLSNSDNGSSSCQDACPSEQEAGTPSAVDVPSPTAGRYDVAENGSCIAETNEHEVVNDVDAIESEFAVSKEPVESSTSLDSSNEVERSLDGGSNSVHGEAGVLEESQELVKDHTASNLSVEKVTTSFCKPQACHIVKIPRFIDNQLSVSIQTAQSEVNEKTQGRDSIKVSIERQKTTCNEFWKKFEDEKSEERAARAVVTAKRQQMDSLQLRINKLKNVQSIEELDSKIQSMEFELQHVTMPLKQEKKYIHEIKQLRQQRDQLTSYAYSSTEINEAFDQKEQIDEQFNLLKKELDSLRTEVLRTEANANAARKKYDEEQQILRRLQQQFRDADALRQKAYGHWRELKNKLTERNKHFSMYKGDQISAQRYLYSRDFEGLHTHCSKQVENIMDLWNNDEEFRMQYVKSNLNSTLWRLKTADGRSLGPDEEPPVIQTNQFRVSVSLPQQPKISYSDPPTSLETKAGTSKEVESFPVLPAARKDHPVKPKKSSKPASEISNVAITARIPDKEIEIDEKLSVQTQAEEELLKKQEELAMQKELRKEKAAAELKEQHRLEEIAKAKAAEERKRRQAQKAQARAEFRAQKEAEKREKMRTKKQKKKVVAAEDTTSIHGADECIAPSSVTTQTTKELNVTAVPLTKKPSRSVAAAKQFNKPQPIPLPLRKKGKRKMSAWMWVLLTAVVVVLLFLAGDYIPFSTFGFQQIGL